MSVLVGLHAVGEALRARRRDISLVVTSDDGIERDARAAGVPCERRDKHALDELAGAGARHQGAIAIVGEYRYVDLEDLLPEARPALVLALDGVTDPQNLGSLVRSAHVLGASGVVLPKDRSALVTPAVVRASAGATEHMKIALVTNLVRALEELKERGLWILGAALEPEAQLPWELDLGQPSGLVIGSEGEGLRRLVRKTCDALVRIPMEAGVGSLNAAVAGATLLYEARRQRAQVARKGGEQ